MYSFEATPGTEIFFDIDRTSQDLDTVIELVDRNGVVLARSDNSEAEAQGAEQHRHQDRGDLYGVVEQDTRAENGLAPGVFRHRAGEQGITGGPQAQALEEAITLAEPGGWIRPFVEAGPVMAAMLQDLDAKGDTKQFVHRVLEAIENAGAAAPVKASPAPGTRVPAPA